MLKPLPQLRNWETVAAPYLQQVIDILRILAQLPVKYKGHNLTANYSGYRECHIEPDWLLIYKLTDDELRLDRTGTHADLFGI